MAYGSCDQQFPSSDGDCHTPLQREVRTRTAAKRALSFPFVPVRQLMVRHRRPSLVVVVALANKTARIAWAVMHRHENYQRVAAAA